MELPHRPRKLPRLLIRLGSLFQYATIAALVCALPFIPLFDLRSTFYYDWFNHLWMIEYFGEYIHQHGIPPAVFSTENLIGITMPLFYASKFYWLAGILCSLTGSSIAFRLITFCSLLLQFCHVERATRCAFDHKGMSMTVATLATWAIYPLTNLYNRSALTEFIAVIFLTSSLCCLFVLMLRASLGEQSYYDAISVGFFYSIAAITHPLTAVFGAAYLICVGACFVFTRQRRWIALVGLVTTVFITILLASWLYVLHRFAGSLPVNNVAANQQLFRVTFFFPDSIDNILSLLSPVAFDARTLYGSVRGVSTPYLDAQINIPLLLLGAFIATQSIKIGRGAFDREPRFLQAIRVVTVFTFVFLLSLILYPKFSRYLGNVFDVLQGAYRLLTYLNLAALTFLFASAGSRSDTFRKSSLRKKDQWQIALVLGLSFLGLVTKLGHANASRYVDSYANLSQLAEIDELPPITHLRPRWFPEQSRAIALLRTLPSTFYSHSQYMVLQDYSLKKPVGFEEQWQLKFSPASGKDFGWVPPATITLERSALVVTNVQPFPWNEIWVNEHLRRNSEIVAMGAQNWSATSGRPGVLAVPLTPGTYTIEYRFHPSTTWQVLEEISFGLFLLWSFVWSLSIMITGIRVFASVEMSSLRG
jgi:hypothetical protein